jgi:hypothetical protein
MYLYCKKINGKKYSVAKWTGGPGTCLRTAEAVFAAHELSGGSVEWEDFVIKQKMYAGNMGMPRFLFLDDTPRQAARYCNNEHIKSYVGMKGASGARSYLLDMWQDDPQAIEDVHAFFRYS